MIEIRDLCKDYGDRRAIDHLNFKVEKGEVVGFLGPNGAGKSTTMKIITGYMAPTSGSVEVAGYDVFENPIEVKQRIGYLPETPPVYGDMIVADYLKYVAQLKKCESSKIPQLVGSAIEKTNLQEVQNRRIQNLSKGFKQRVGIAQAIVSEPEILILDEPTVGLDPKQVAEIRMLISQLRGQHTIILSTHILPEVQANCERLIIINNGKIVAKDSLAGLTNKLTEGKKVSVRVQKISDVFLDSVKALSGVTSLHVNGDQFSFTYDGGDDVLASVSKTIVGADAGLLEFKPENVGLEDIFIKLTSNNELGGIQ